MGDRGQIIIRRDGTDIHFYTHWSGSKLPATLASALKRGISRWNDDSYLARIIFCEMVADDVSGTTGLGISTQYQDSCEETDLIIDMDNQTVTYLSLTYSFSEYVKLSPVCFADILA